MALIVHVIAVCSTLPTAVLTRGMMFYGVDAQSNTEPVPEHEQNIGAG